MNVFWMSVVEAVTITFVMCFVLLLVYTVVAVLRHCRKLSKEYGTSVVFEFKELMEELFHG